MNPQEQFCPNPACRASGKTGNIWIHSRKEKRYRCKRCKRTFTESYETALYRLKKPATLFITVITLLAYGCPVQAVVKAFSLDERTVWAWIERAGRQCRRLHEGEIACQQLELGQIQADELKIKTYRGVVWLGMVMMVQSRLWLGGEVSKTRNQKLLKTVFEFAAQAGKAHELLVAVDGLNLYLQVIPQVFSKSWNWLQGQWQGWNDVAVVQTMKQKGNKRGHIDRQIAWGEPTFIQRMLQKSQGKGWINSAYIERLNATFRSRMACLVRDGRCLLHKPQRLQAWMWLLGTVYNWATYHESLALELKVTEGKHFWLNHSPAIAAHLTDHCWSVEEILKWKYPQKRHSILSL